MSETKGKPPVFKLKIGTIDFAVWEQEGKTKDGKPTKFLTVDFHRNYMDKNTNTWKQTNTLRVNDLPVVQLGVQKCYEFAKLNSKDTEE